MVAALSDDDEVVFRLHLNPGIFALATKEMGRAKKVFWRAVARAREDTLTLLRGCAGMDVDDEEEDDAETTTVGN